MSKYNLGLVEILIPLLHGNKHYKENWVNSCYLTYESNISLIDFYTNTIFDDIEYLNDQIKDRVKYLEDYSQKDIYHPSIRNYKNIVSKLNYVNLEIIDTKIIYDGEDYINVSIKKTFWLKILQRKWKNYLRKKLLFIKNLHNLRYREIHGKYPAFRR